MGTYNVYLVYDDVLPVQKTGSALWRHIKFKETFYLRILLWINQKHLLGSIYLAVKHILPTLPEYEGITKKLTEKLPV